MTKNEALQAMRDGKKLTHKSFTDDEWIKSNQSGTIFIMEDGVECSPHEFWQWRTDERWEKDWEIFSDPVPTIETYKQELIKYLKPKNITGVHDLWAYSKDYYANKLIEMGGGYASFGNTISVHILVKGDHFKFKVSLVDIQSVKQ